MSNRRPTAGLGAELTDKDREDYMATPRQQMMLLHLRMARVYADEAHTERAIEALIERAARGEDR